MLYYYCYSCQHPTRGAASLPFPLLSPSFLLRLSPGSMPMPAQHPSPIAQTLLSPRTTPPLALEREVITPEAEMTVRVCKSSECLHIDGQLV